MLSTLTSIINWFIDSLAWVLGGALEILPDSPFLEMNNQVQWGMFGSAIRLFFDVGSMVVHFSLYVTAIGLYYIIRMVLRWLKMIQ